MSWMAAWRMQLLVTADRAACGEKMRRTQQGDNVIEEWQQAGDEGDQDDKDGAPDQAERVRPD